jgi:AraC-like DNA-binding protein
MLLFNKGYKSASRYFSGFLIFSSIYSLANYAFFFSHSVFWVAIFETIIPTFFFLICPFCFFYVRSILRDDTALSKTDYFHFLPFLLVFLQTVPFLFTSWDYKLQLATSSINGAHTAQKIHFLLSNTFIQALCGIQMLVYLWVIWSMLYNYALRVNEGKKRTSQYKLMRKWLFTLMSLLTITALSLIVIIFKYIILYDDVLFLKYTYYHILFAVSVYSMLNLGLLFFPQIMYGLPVATAIPEENAEPEFDLLQDIECLSFSEVENDIADGGDISDKNTPLFYSQEYIDKIEHCLNKYKHTREFANPDFVLDNISAKCGIPIHHLSYYFNSIINVKFADWRNGLRVDFAIEQIKQDSSDVITFKVIALNSGFSSQNTFIRAFKNTTGKTPREFLKELRKSELS